MRLARAARRALSLLAIVAGIVAIVVGVDVGAALAYASHAKAMHVSHPSVASQRGGTMLVFGDSLAYGYRATPGRGWVDDVRRRLMARDPNVRVYNRAVCGTRVRDVPMQAATRRFADVHAVVVVSGGNDLMAVADPLSFALDERATLESLAARYPHAHLLIANVPDISFRAFALRPGVAPEHLPEPIRSGFSLLVTIDDAIIARMAPRYGANILDLHDLVANGSGADAGMKHLTLAEFDARYVSDDGLHPSDRGYALLADFAWPKVARAMDVTP